MRALINLALLAGRLAALVALAGVAQLARAQDAEEAPPAHWWGDLGLGYAHMSAGSGPSTAGGGVWLDAQVGGRLNRQWLLGLDLGGFGGRESASYYNSSNAYSSVYGESITNIFLVAQFEPHANHGWLAGLGGGQVLYGNRDLEAYTGRTRSGSGMAAMGRVGYDWRLGSRTHAEAILSIESGHVSLGAPLSGGFGFTVVALSAHFAFH